MATIEARIGEIEFDLIEDEKTVGQIARDNGFSDTGAMGAWLVEQRQIQLWRDLQTKARAAGEKPVTVTKRPPPPPTPQPAQLRSVTAVGTALETPEPTLASVLKNPPSPTEEEQPMDERGTVPAQKWAYVKKGLASPKKRTVAKAQKIQDLMDDLIATVDAEAEEVEALKKIKNLEEQLAAEKAKIRKPSAPKASSSGDNFAAQVRKWAQENGHEVPDRGRMSPKVYEAYSEAHS